MHRRLFAALLVTMTAALSLAVLMPRAEALPARAPAPLTSPGLASQLAIANTGGKYVCGVTITTDGGTALYVVGLPGSSSGPDRSGLYTRDLVSGAERRVVTPTQATGLACGAASGDGRLYAYVSCPAGGGSCTGPLRIVDTTTGAVTTVAATQSPNGQPVLDFRGVSLSDDHRFVFMKAFVNGSLFRYDTTTGALASAGTSVEGFNGMPYSTSANGQRIAFSGPTTINGSASYAVVVHDFVTGQDTIASMRAGKPIPGTNARLTPDGTSVVFEQFVDESPQTGKVEIARMNLATSTRQVLTHAAGGGVVNGNVSLQDISGDGKVVVFTSPATNLTTGITYPPVDPLPPLSDFNDPVFSVDASGVTKLVTRSTAASAPSNAGGGQATIDRAGTTIVYASPATDLVAGYVAGAGGGAQAYAFDRATSSTTLLTPSPDNPKQGQYTGIDSPAISHAGGRVLFSQYSQFVSGLMYSLAQVATPAAVEVGRVAGTDRYETAALVSSAAFPTSGIPFVLIASGESFPDALAAGPAAAALHAPVLLTSHGRLPLATADELSRLRPKKILVIGGPGSIDDSVVSTLTQYVPNVSIANVTRLSGPDRYATAVAVSVAVFPSGAATVHVATGRSFPDALSGAAAAGAAGGPLLLVDTASIPTGVAAELDRLNPSKIVILGGTSTVASSVETALGPLAPTVVRRAGADRYATSAAVSKGAFPNGATAAYLATGETFPDALSGSAGAATVPAPVLLVRPTCLPGSVADELVRLDPPTVILFGGTSSIAPAVATGQRCPS